MTVQTSAEFKDDELRKFLNDLSRNIKKASNAALPKLITAFSAIVFADVERHFRSQEGPTGKWAPWSKLYRERQDLLGKYKEPGNILQNTGKLRQSFKPTNFRKKSGAFLWYNNSQTKDGFAYAVHHDELAKTTRPFMWLSRKAFDLISVATLDILMQESE